MSLGLQLARGAGWAFASSWVQSAVSLAAFALIARWIGPEAFGLHSLAAAPVYLLAVPLGSAAGEALFQKLEPDEALWRSWFWLLLLLATVLALLTLPLALLLAGLYAQPGLISLLSTYALLLPLTAVQTVPEAALLRRLSMRKLAFANTTAALAGAACGLVAAAQGEGAWSLLWMNLAQQALRSLLICRASRWRPGWPPARAGGMSGLLRFSSATVAARWVSELDKQAPRLIIGLMLGATATGYYAMARRFFELASDLLLRPVNSLALPGIAAARRDGLALRPIYESTLLAVTALAYPAFLGLVVVAPLLVPLLLGTAWLPAVAAVQLMALIGLRSAASGLNGAVLRGLGRADWQLGLSGLGLLLTLLLVPLGAQWGLEWAVAAVLLRSFATWPPGAMMVQKLTGIPLRSQYGLGGPALLLALTMALALQGLLPLLRSQLPDLPSLLLGVLAGVALYLLLLRGFAPVLWASGLQLLKTRSAARG